MDLDADVLRYYSLGGEADRLVVDGLDGLEFLRTKELIAGQLGPAPLDIVDVGGASGRYAAWLAELGHRVHLIDPVPLHIEQASARASAGPAFAATLGDARGLPFPDATVDVVLALGPLYHLIEPADRHRALSEAHRVLRPGGWVAAAAISRFASSIDGVVRGFAADPSFRTGVHRALATGVHRSTNQAPGHFTTAYFHRPDELHREVEAAGFAVEEVFGVEGPGGYLADRQPSWREPSYRETMMALARAVETEPSLLGFGPHLLAIGTRPA